MKKWTVAMLALVVIVLVGGCGSGTSNDADKVAAVQTAQSMSEAQKQIGMPAVVNFQEKKLAKMIYELRDKENIVCYAYLKSLDGHPVFLGKCIGFGLPYCVQYSNPERIARDRSATEWWVGTLPQPEPNGLFMPQSLSATWLMMIDPKTGDARPVYIEPEIIVSPFPLAESEGTDAT